MPRGQNMKLLGAKLFSGSPADGIDNATKALFGRMSPNELELYSGGTFEPHGALKKLTDSRYTALFSGAYQGLWGIGHIKELLLVFLKPRRVKYFINFHTILIKGGEGRWRPRTPWFIRKYIFSRADLIISPSEFSASTVRKNIPGIRVVSILNGVDIKLFDPAKKNPSFLKEKYQIRTDRPIVAFVGTLQARKRPDIFIEIARHFPEAQFVMVGRSFPEHDFLAAAKPLINFQYLPAMPREDIAVLLASSVAFIFPSLDEPSAAVILEAMASGAVPILSKSGGNAEFLKDGESGFLIPPDESEIDGFITILKKIIADSIFHAGIVKGARRNAERHSFDSVVREYQAAILSMLK
jgi:glycosyltransferase involved in cell wall biosynthesis